jgi:hypothetical protein
MAASSLQSCGMYVLTSGLQCGISSNDNRKYEQVYIQTQSLASAC